MLCCHDKCSQGRHKALSESVVASQRNFLNFYSPYLEVLPSDSSICTPAISHADPFTLQVVFTLKHSVCREIKIFNSLLFVKDVVYLIRQCI